MFFSPIILCRPFGVPIKLGPSLILLALFLAMQTGNLIFGIITAAALMLSVALHELGHTLVVLKLGYRVTQIDLTFIGGCARIEGALPRTPWKEFVIAAAGPLVSLALWLIPTPLSPMNKWLFLFNLIPAFPMDGGRMLRALLATHFSYKRATFFATRIGKIASVGFAIAGFLFHNFSLFVIAFFVWQSAGAEYAALQFENDAPPDDDVVRISRPPYAKKGIDRANLKRN